MDEGGTAGVVETAGVKGETIQYSMDIYRSYRTKGFYPVSGRGFIISRTARAAFYCGVGKGKAQLASEGSFYRISSRYVLSFLKKLT